MGLVEHCCTPALLLKEIAREHKPASMTATEPQCSHRRAKHVAAVGSALRALGLIGSPVAKSHIAFGSLSALTDAAWTSTNGCRSRRGARSHPARMTSLAP